MSVSWQTKARSSSLQTGNEFWGGGPFAHHTFFCFQIVPFFRGGLHAEFKTSVGYQNQVLVLFGMICNRLDKRSLQGHTTDQPTSLGDVAVQHVFLNGKILCLPSLWSVTCRRDCSFVHQISFKGFLLFTIESRHLQGMRVLTRMFEFLDLAFADLSLFVQTLQFCQSRLAVDHSMFYAGQQLDTTRIVEGIVVWIKVFI
jgi:hypothetical protein